MQNRNSKVENGTSASLVQNGVLCAGRVYVIEVDKGAWDDWSWWIHGIYDCPIKADEAKRKLLAKIEADKLDKRWVVAHHAKSINEVQVKEYKLNEVASR